MLGGAATNHGGIDSLPADLGATDIGRVLVRLASRKTQRKRAALSQHALDRQVTAHRPRELTTDRESKSGPTVRTTLRRLDLNERLEHGFELVGGNTHTGVLHPEADLITGRFGHYSHRAAGGRELDGVGEKI